MLKDMDLEQKKEWGPICNNLKQELTEHYEERKKVIEAEYHEKLQRKKQAFDVTSYYAGNVLGSLHPYTHLTSELENIFVAMGYTVVDGPEVDTDFYNFEALNIPKNHSARDLHDTFWLTLPRYLMRTHTSTVQIHTLEKKELPLALFAPGRVFRNEAVDASHDFMFQQGEILYVNKDVSLANLFATARTFLRAVFGSQAIELRIRPGYFPFVEPGVEIDASCPFCTTGCSTCKQSRWIELLGAGLIHPNVLRACGIDPDMYTGFALGFGLTRMAMIKYSIPDVRLFHSHSLDFLTQF
jgi:phenylalanyl-tRNA synthetase alpha chain